MPKKPENSYVQPAQGFIPISMNPPKKVGKGKAKAEEWEQNEVDLFLSYWFAGYSWKRILELLERVPKWDGSNMAWKFATGYIHPNSATSVYRNYKPGPLRGKPTPAKVPLHRREEKAIELALFGKGKESNPPMDVAQVAAVLNRPVAVVQKYVDRRTPSRKGFGIEL